MSKRRHQTIDLGTIAAGGFSAEIDMSSFTHLILYLEWPTGFAADFALQLQASPTPFSEAADWYWVNSPSFVSGNIADERIVFPAVPASGLPANPLDQATPAFRVYDPFAVYDVELPTGEFPSARRLRVFNVASSNAQNADANVKAQLIRRVG